MAVTVLIPTPLRAYTEKKGSVTLKGGSVGEVLQQLLSTHSDLRRHLMADDGTLRSYVNIYLNDEDIRYLEKEATPVKDNDVLSIVPSIAGGRA